MTNGVDYVFHLYLGRALAPGDFAVFQTVNSTLIVGITAFGVFQPVVARFVAERAGNRQGQIAVFQEYFRWGSWAGLAGAGLVLGFRNVLGEWLNVPPLAIGLSAGVVLLAFSRPVVWGMLQGQARFVTFGLTRLAYAVSRFAIAAGLLAWGWAAMGAVAALPVGMVLSLGVGLLALWPSLTPLPPLPTGEGAFNSLTPGPSPAGRGGADSPSFIEGGVRETNPGVRAGLRLAGYAFVAYAAHTALLNLDMVWVNRFFLPDEAGAYAGAVLLRRILLLLPGVIVVVFYPRVVAVIEKKQLPDRLLALSLGAVGGIVLGLTAVYFAAGSRLMQFVFGKAFALAGPLLGWMGLGILGYSLGTLWMNLALATRPRGFVALLVGGVVVQTLGLVSFGGTLAGVVGAFVLSGWGLALGGGIWYAAWCRPRLVYQYQTQ